MIECLAVHPTFNCVCEKADGHSGNHYNRLNNIDWVVGKGIGISQCPSKAAVHRLSGGEEVVQCNRLEGHSSSVLHWNRNFNYSWPNDHFLTNQPDQPEKVDHPPRYNTNPSGVECIDVVEHMTFNAGNAIKYIWRHGEKGDAVEDLRKAIWYIEREIARIERFSAHISPSGE